MLPTPDVWGNLQNSGYPLSSFHVRGPIKQTNKTEKEPPESFYLNLDLTQEPTTKLVTTTTTPDIITSNTQTTLALEPTSECEKYKTEQNSTQNALQTMLNAECSDSR